MIRRLQPPHKHCSPKAAVDSARLPSLLPSLQVAQRGCSVADPPDWGLWPDFWPGAAEVGAAALQADPQVEGLRLGQLDRDERGHERGVEASRLLRELLRGIGEYTDRNRYINTRVVVVDKNHEICGTGSFGRRFADPCEVSPDSGTGKNTPGMMNAMEKLTAGWVRRIFIFFSQSFFFFSV